MQRHTTHYAAYAQYGAEVIPEIVAWYRAGFDGGAIEMHTELRSDETVETLSVKGAE
jgi:hypothetical protein